MGSRAPLIFLPGLPRRLGCAAGSVEHYIEDQEAGPRGEVPRRGRLPLIQLAGGARENRPRFAEIAQQVAFQAADHAPGQFAHILFATAIPPAPPEVAAKGEQQKDIDADDKKNRLQGSSSKLIWMPPGADLDLRAQRLSSSPPLTCAQQDQHAGHEQPLRFRHGLRLEVRITGGLERR